MSKPAANPFFEVDFSKFMDMSKMMGDMKMPSFNYEAMMGAMRRNIEACTAVNQAAFENIQAMMRRQTEVGRQSFEEMAAMMNTMMSCPTPEEKMIRQAEASKVAVEKCMANAREVAETVAKCNYQAMETMSNRMNEGIEELRSMMKPAQAA
jgi:phasin family protein